MGEIPRQKPINGGLTLSVPKGSYMKLTISGDLEVDVNGDGDSLILDITFIQEDEKTEAIS